MRPLCQAENFAGHARLNGRRIREILGLDAENFHREKISFRPLCFGGFHRCQFPGKFQTRPDIRLS